MTHPPYEEGKREERAWSWNDQRDDPKSEIQMPALLHIIVFVAVVVLYGAPIQLEYYLSSRAVVVSSA